MKLYVMVKTYNLYGGNTSLSLIADYLSDDAPYFGPAINELTVTMHFVSSPPPKKTLESLFHDYHASFTKLPKVVFRRSREQASVDYISTLLDGRDLHTSRRLSLELFRAGLSEVVDHLSMLRSRLKPSDSFDLANFLAHCEHRRDAAPESQEVIDILATTLKRKRQEAVDRLSPWDKLGLDWRDFHPGARTKLDDPFYWSSTDEFSPNGNDTGADVLGLYRDWIKRNPERPATEFLASLFHQWGFSLPPDSAAAQQVYDEASIGLAFAELKLRATCDKDVAVLATAAASRQRAEAELATDWPPRETRLKALERIESKLLIGA